MKTNFTTATKLVLTDSSDKIMAIISVEAGAQNIAPQVEQAIREDLDVSEVILDTALVYSLGRDNYQFDAEVIEDDDENEVYSFALVPVAEY